MTPVRLEPVASRSRVKHSTTEPLSSHYHNGSIKITVVYMHTCDPEGTWTDAGYGSCQVGIIDIACVCKICRALAHGDISSF